MATIPAPYLYASFEDVKRYCPLQAAVWDRAVAMFGGRTEIESLIEDTSRTVDTQITLRRSVPLTSTPHRSIRKYVSMEVAAMVCDKSGSLPSGELQAFKDRAFAQFKTFIESATTPNAFLDIPESNDAGAASSFTQPQTFASTRSSPYASDDPWSPGYNGGGWP